MRLLLSLSALATLVAAAPPPPAALPLHVGGRVVAEANGSLGFGWPGIYFEGRFRGTGVRTRFDAPAEHMRLLVDGEEKAVFRRPGRADLALEGLAPGEHVVRLEKMTESQTGGGSFLGFFPSKGGTPLSPRPRSRQIEFIGDSFTVGYGNSSATRECSEREVHDTTDSQRAFGPLVARHFDADYRINAYSGFGIVRNYGGSSPGLGLPAIYDRLKPDDAARLEPADPRWHPQIIVINLGTNDFSTPLKAGEAWRDAEALKTAYRERYVAFVRALHARQPQARVILMGSDLFFAEVERVANTLRGELRVSALRFDGLEYGGCHSHPSLADDAKLAALLERRIDAILAEG